MMNIAREKKKNPKGTTHGNFEKIPLGHPNEKRIVSGINLASYIDSGEPTSSSRVDPGISMTYGTITYFRTRKSVAIPWVRKYVIDPYVI
jgi:hypothetical protein